MLVIDKVYKSFADTAVLNDVNLRLEVGKIYTLRGGNGSGKTTLFNIISGFMRPSSGTITWNGKPITRFTPHRINRLGIGRTFQDLRLTTQMTVRENILTAMEEKFFSFPSKEQQEKVDTIMKRVSLLEKADELAGEISYGQQKLLTLGCCIANDADLLLIDEPVAGIDKKKHNVVMGLIIGLKESGKTIFQIEHHPDYIQATSDVVLMLEGGKIVC